MIALSLCFSSAPPKMTSMPFLANVRISGSDRPKCSATSLYSFDSGLPNTPTSSVWFSDGVSMPVPVQEGFHEVGQVEGRKLTPSTTVHSLTFPAGRIPGQSHSTNELFINRI